MDQQRRVFLIAVMTLTILTLALDRLIFGWLIFKIENPSGWDSFRWYNFEYQFQRIENLDPKEKENLILVVGSSIAQYSLQKDMLERDLNRLSGKSYRVEFLTHAAMLPTDLKYYAERIKKLKPYRVLYLTNPADLDMERFTPPWEFGSEYRSINHTEFLKARYPMKIFYSVRFALDHYRSMKIDETLSLLGRGILYSILFRNEWYDPVEYSLHSPVKPRKRYLFYQGKSVKEGLFIEGVTGKCFSFSGDRILNAEIRKNLYINDFYIQFFARKKDEQKMPGRFETNLEEHYKTCCRIKTSYRPLLKFKPEKIGWQKFLLPEILEDEEYFAVLSHVEDAGGNPVAGNEASYSGKGIRLPGNFGIDQNQKDDLYVRRRGLEEIRLASLSEKEYISDFNRRIQPEDWRNPAKGANRQLNLLRLGKFYTHWIDFKEIRQLQEIREVINILDGIPVVIVNNPENPLTAAEYSWNRWYESYRNYFLNLSEKHGNVYFFDISGSMSMINFIDSHHLTYDAILKLSPVYAQMILDTEKHLKN